MICLIMFFVSLCGRRVFCYVRFWKVFDCSCWVVIMCCFLWVFGILFFLIGCFLCCGVIFLLRYMVFFC